MSQQVKYYKAKYLVVWDEGQHKILENGFLGVKDGLVESFGKALPEGAEYEDLGAAAITPGFVNTHFHPSEVFNIKSAVEDIINPYFYSSTMMDLAYPDLGEEAAILQCKLALTESLKSGCTTNVIAGSANSRLEAEVAGGMGLRAYLTAGIRAGDAKERVNIWNTPDGHSVTFNFDEEQGFQRIKEAEEFVKDYEGSFNGRIHTLLGPTQTMTCTPAMLRATRDLADKLGVGITVHVGEDVIEVEACVRQHGKSPVQLMADTGLIGEDVLIGHCVYTHGHKNMLFPEIDECRKDLKLLGDSKTNVAHCPLPFARVGEIFQSISRYTKAGVNIGIGTDSFPCDLIQEMRLAALLGKIAEGNAYGVNAGQIFNMATVNGAKAVGRTDIGRLAPGAKADFAVFKLNAIEMIPTRDIIKNIVYSTTRHSVDRVYIEGDCMVKDGKMIGMDEEAMTAEFQAMYEAAWKKMGGVMVGDKTMEEQFPMTYPIYNK